MTNERNKAEKRKWNKHRRKRPSTKQMTEQLRVASNKQTRTTARREKGAKKGRRTRSMEENSTKENKGGGKN